MSFYPINLKHYLIIKIINGCSLNKKKKSNIDNSALNNCLHVGRGLVVESGERSSPKVWPVISTAGAPRGCGELATE